MKTFSPILILLLFGLIASAFAQYGIPEDDDDHLPPANYVHERSPAPEAELPKEVNPPLTTSYTKYEDETPVEMKGFSPTFDIRREQRMLYETPAVENPVQPGFVEIRHESPIQHAVNNVYTYSLEDMDAYVRSFETAPPLSTPAELPVPSTHIRFDSNSNNGEYNHQPTSYGDVQRTEAVPIVKYIMESDHRGNFRMETLTGDGTLKIINGHLKQVSSSDSPVVVKTGTFSYTGDDGKVYRTDWQADENGYKAFGDHIP